MCIEGVLRKGKLKVKIFLYIFNCDNINQKPGKMHRVWSWCEVAQAEIQTCNLPIANPALYHKATSAPGLVVLDNIPAVGIVMSVDKNPGSQDLYF